MSEQKFYGKQPAELPLTLPAGTRIISQKDWYFTEEANLTTGNCYGGMHWDGHRNSHCERVCTADKIDWRSVPVPAAPPPIQPGTWLECINADQTSNLLTVGARYQVVEVPNPTNVVFTVGGLMWHADRFKRVDGPAAGPECAACGGDNDLRAIVNESPFHKQGVAPGTLICKHCDSIHLDTPGRIRSRRSTAAAEPDRPIQAGDWVECVEARLSLLLVLGRRYHVANVTDSGWLVLTGVDATMYTPSRFKRVDGPHPVAKPVRSFGESEEICASCSEAAARFVEVMCEKAGDGKWYCEGCIDGAHERHGSEAAELPRYCPECPAALTSENVGDDPYCVDCTKRRRRATAGPSDPYRAHNFAKQPDKGDIHNRPGNVAARARLQAWELSTKPRAGNPSDAREFAKPHPWEEFDPLESR